MLLNLDGPCREPRRLIGALLRVDLGARIRVDHVAGRVQMEGRFWKHEVIAAIERQGYRLRGWEERPLSPRVMPGALAA
ncbi:hypothetical protein [Lysobacter niastensis]|nr:hypothetical protein [Lysobacter niastensis]